MNVAVIAICAVTCLGMILSVLFIPKLHIGKIHIDTYWLVTLVGAVIAVAVSGVKLKVIGEALIADNAINPIKILVLFISMTILSIFLDELQFFRYLASIVLKRAKTGQLKLFLYLYLIVSVLTVFTSNDIIILSFTPFICYFAKNAHIDPTPYLAAEFVAANTWSLALIIGNPTNIYLATANGIDFLTYIKFSFIPTIFAGVVALGALLLVFGRKLREPLSGEAEVVKVEDKFLLWVGIAHLAVCTILLAIGSYIRLEMWIVALGAVVSLGIFALVTSLVRKKKPAELGRCLRRSPFQLVPFVLSMFVMILVLGEEGVVNWFGELLGTDYSVWKYGLASFFFANVVNNIPMSVLFSSIIEAVGVTNIPAVFATIIGSNIGAFMTPIGALAGIMWSSIISEHGIKFGYRDFLKIGVTVAIPTLAAALGGLCIASLLFL